MHRTLIAGGPRVGKTTLSRVLAAGVGVTARSTDELIGTVAFADAPLHVARWIEAEGPWVIEGVAVPRALRHWLAHHDDGIPCERVFWSDTPKVPQSARQAVMAKGCATVWRQIVAELESRGVTIHAF